MRLSYESSSLRLVCLWELAHIESSRGKTMSSKNWTKSSLVFSVANKRWHLSMSAKDSLLVNALWDNRPRGKPILVSKTRVLIKQSGLRIDYLVCWVGRPFDNLVCLSASRGSSTSRTGHSLPWHGADTVESFPYHDRENIS